MLRARLFRPDRKVLQRRSTALTPRSYRRDSVALRYKWTKAAALKRVFRNHNSARVPAHCRQRQLIGAHVILCKVRVRDKYDTQWVVSFQTKPAVNTRTVQFCCSGQVRHSKGGVVPAAADGAGWLLADERPQLGEAQQGAIRGGLQPPDGCRCA